MQTINNYTIDETKWQLRGGNGECNIATKKGKKYFIKRLIKLKYPVSDLLPQKVKAEKIRECTEWLRRRNAILKALPGDGTGNVVKPIEYFREGPFYYEVANMVEIASLETDEIQKKSVKDKALIMLTAATSIADIHAAGIVHGDLDPGNILISKSNSGKIIAKIIDFTDAFMAKDPPESIMSKEYWWSPEVAQYAISSERPNPWRKFISCKADVFSLGIIFYQYCSGGKGPGCSSDYPWQDVCKQKKLKMDSSIDDRFRVIISSMLELEPDKRISIKEVCAKLKEIYTGRSGITERITEPPPSNICKKGLYKTGSNNLYNGHKIVEVLQINAKKVNLVLDNGKSQIMDVSLAKICHYIRD